MSSNKPNKKQPKTVWEKVQDQDKDFFFLFLEKKVRNVNKKLKEIQQLEEALAAKKELKPEQVEKVNSKSYHLERIAEWESIASLWHEAHKERREQVSPTELALRQLLAALKVNSKVKDLLTQPNPSIIGLASQLEKEISTETAPVDDVPYEGFQIAQAVLAQAQPQVSEPQQQVPVQTEVTEAPEADPQPQPQIQTESDNQPQAQESVSQSPDVQPNQSVDSNDSPKKESDRSDRPQREERVDNKRRYNNRDNYNKNGPRKPRRNDETYSPQEEEDGFQTVSHKHPSKPKPYYNRGGDRRQGQPKRDQVQYVPKN